MAAFARSLTARLALLVSTLALIALAAEATCRMLGLPFQEQTTGPAGQESLARFDHEVGWSYIPNHSTSRPYGEPVRDIAMHFDERGLRSAAPGRRLDADRPTLLFVGGSFTMGHGVIAEAALPARVATGRFAACQVVNAGVEGYGTDQSLLALRRYASSFNTIAVIYTYMDDHLQRNGNRDRRLLYPNERFPGTKPLFALDRSGIPYLAHAPETFEDYAYSRLLALMRTRLSAPKPVELTRQLIETMRREVEAAGAVFIAVDWGWPQGGRDHPSIFGPLEAGGMRVLYSEESPPRNWRYMVIPGSGHPTVQAYGHVAKRLRGQLARAKVHCEP